MLMRGYQDCRDLEDEATSVAFIGDRKTYLPVLGVPPFDQGPGDIAMFAAIYEIIHKLNHMLLVGSYHCPQEDLGTACILSAFTEDTDKIARTDIDDAHVLDDTSYSLHSTS